MSEGQIEAQLVDELLKCNEALAAKLHTMKTYIDSTEADGWVGEGDPLLLTFRSTFEIHQTRVEHYCSIDIRTLKAPPESIFQRASASVESLVGRVLFQTRSRTDQLKDEINSRKHAFNELEKAFQTIKMKTESSEKYAEFCGRLPKGRNLVATEDKSDIIDKVSRLNPRIGSRSRYMEDQILSRGMPLIPQASIAHGFDVLRMEVDYLCLGFWSAKVNELLRQILKELAGMARRFAVVINNYYAGELGKDFGRLASARFQATYLLVQGMSSLNRSSMIIERPTIMFFRRSDFACNPRMLTQNLNIINTPSIQRRFTSFSCTQNLKVITTMCSEFHKDTQSVLQGLACSTETIVPNPGVRRSHAPMKLAAGVEAMLEHDVYDVDFVRNVQESPPLRTVQMDIEIEANEIAATLRGFGLREMQLPFNDSEPIGRGSFATVREVPWGHSNLRVAIKCYKVISSEQRSIKRFVREAQTMSDLRHSNVLSVFGYARLPSPSEEDVQEVDADADFITYALVYPVYRNGSLLDYMNTSRNLSECLKLKILLDVASALSYLHDPAKTIGVVVHGDVRAANVLITPMGRALLCDFGLSRHSNMNERWQTLSMQTNPAWMAYEFFDIVPTNEAIEPQKPTVKTDIYAFGCVCYEVVHGKAPYHECAANQLQISARKAHGIPPVVDIPSSYHARPHLKRLMEICWRKSPPRRPSASQLVYILKGFVDAFL